MRLVADVKSHFHRMKPMHFALATATNLRSFWRSDHYGELSKGVLSRPAFKIETP
ncbi:MAG: hypothetical protein JWL59_5018 [Chthoniobacteraceae bacterium]|nr:hypothetical protein [Chthoniobacteraceae bacterium]